MMCRIHCEPRIDSRDLNRGSQGVTAIPVIMVTSFGWFIWWRTASLHSAMWNSFEEIVL
uniref:Uncharacterized protein n=1 Tax=Arundo donax TaxID=35708 RepID=A0A0A9HEM2_ARUDO